MHCVRSTLRNLSRYGWARARTKGRMVMMTRRIFCALLFAAAVCGSTAAYARERLCDASAGNCRTVAGADLGLLEYINTETQAIDVGVWFWKDQRYIDALVAA